jgi:hypothetical protein
MIRARADARLQFGSGYDMAYVRLNRHPGF